MLVDWCCMCKQCGETMDHLLLHCVAASHDLSQTLQKEGALCIRYDFLVFPMFEVHWVMPKRVAEVLFWLEELV